MLTIYCEAEAELIYKYIIYKLIYKYQILYLYRITIVAWRRVVNDIDLFRSLKSPKKSIKPPILAFKVIEFGGNREPVYDLLLLINSNRDPISHR